MNLSLGLSGCKLELIDDKIIRKYSSSVEYNSRLSKQIDKQVLFSNFILKNINTPKVYKVDKNKRYSFDMEYIQGLSFYEYFSSSSIADVEFTIQTLFSYFDFIISSSKNYPINTQILSKISLLETKTNFKEYLIFLKKHLLDATIVAPKTFCHGDLTFTNILFHKNRLFFIDFLDSYVDSFLCDFVKLKQDLFYHWNLNINNIQSIRIKQIYRYIWNSIYEKYNSYIESETFYILDAINSLRIEPYVTDQFQKDILHKIIKNSNLYEKFTYTNGRKIV